MHLVQRYTADKLNLFKMGVRGKECVHMAVIWRGFLLVFFTRILIYSGACRVASICLEVLVKSEMFSLVSKLC